MSEPDQADGDAPVKHQLPGNMKKGIAISENTLILEMIRWNPIMSGRPSDAKAAMAEMPSAKATGTPMTTQNANRPRSRTSAETLERNLEEQRQSIEIDDAEKFHALDYRFHQLICERGGSPLTFETIQECKQKVDRLCMLSHNRKDELSAIFADHQELANALKDGLSDEATAVARRHLSRLDDTIAEFYQSHPEYFELTSPQYKLIGKYRR